MKSVLLLLYISFFLCFFFCTASKIEMSKMLAEQNSGSDSQSSTVDSTLHKAKEITLTPPSQISLKNWMGKNFVVLEKQQMFCQHGYELFYYTGLDSSQLTDNTEILKPQNRIPCNELRGHFLVVRRVEESNGEGLVLFSDAKTNKEIIGKTYKKSIKEIIPESDLIWAKNHWQNKFVFSRKGVISTYSKDSNSFGSLKVRIQDSLLVVDVIAGFSPLPVNPIWLIVKTPLGQQGLIPVRCSWTNVMVDMVREGNPWSADIMEIDPTRMHSWDEAIWEIINNHRVVLDMSRDQVLLSWGEPVLIEKQELNGKKMECWRYGAQSLYFDQNILIKLETNQ